MLGRLRHQAFLWLNQPELRFRVRSRLTAPWYRFRFAAFGSNNVFVRPRLIKGGHKIAIGDNCIVYPQCSLSVETAAWKLDGPRLTLGEGVVLRANVTISCGNRIELDDYAAIGGNTLIIDNDHTIDGSAETILAMPVVSTPMRIGRGVWVGDNVSILRGASIGDYAVIGAGAVVTKEIPPYAIAVGVPAKVIGEVPRAERDRAAAQA